MSKKKDRKIKAISDMEIDSSKKNKDFSPKVFQRNKIDYELNIKQRDDLTERQKQLIDIILDKEIKVVFLSGPAGTSKTFVSVLAGLMLMNKHNISDIIYIRSVIESASKSMGYLPGLAEDKMEPYARPMIDKLEEMLPQDQINQLIKEKRVEALPVNFLRGNSFNAKFIIADEAQNFDIKELTTIITRLGKFSKLIISGDPSQSDINGKSGFIKFFDLFNDEESKNNGLYCFSFTKDDIVRSGILKYIIEKIENYNQKNIKNEPMFPLLK